LGACLLTQTPGFLRGSLRSVRSTAPLRALQIPSLLLKTPNSSPTYQPFCFFLVGLKKSPIQEKNKTIGKFRKSYLKFFGNNFKLQPFVVLHAITNHLLF